MTMCESLLAEMDATLECETNGFVGETLRDVGLWFGFLESFAVVICVGPWFCLVFLG